MEWFLQHQFCTNTPLNHSLLVLHREKAEKRREERRRKRDAEEKAAKEKRRQEKEKAADGTDATGVPHASAATARVANHPGS